MRQLLAVLVAAMMILAGCATDTIDVEPPGPVPPPVTQADVEPPAGSWTLESLGFDAATAEPVIPLSYLIKQSQSSTSWAWWQLVQNMGAKVLWADSNDSWSKNNMQFSTDSQKIVVRYTDVDLDPIGSSWTYGETKIGSSEDEAIPDWSFLFSACGADDPIKVTESHSITLDQTRSTSTTKTIKNDIQVGAKATENVSGTIGGVSVGASLEESVQDTYGWQTDDTQAKSESQSTTTTVDLETEVTGGTAVLALLKTTRITSATPFTAQGPWTGGVQLLITDDWYGDGLKDSPEWKAWLASSVQGDGHRYIEWQSLDDFASTLQGYDTERPAYTTADTGRFAKFVDVLTDPRSRMIRLHGTQRRSYQSGAEYSFQKVPCGQEDAVAEANAIPPGNVRSGQ